MDNLRQKLKIFNYRPLVLIFLGLIFGVLVKNFINKYTAVTVSGIIIVVLVLLLYSILHKKFKYCVIIGLTFIMGFGIYSYYTNSRTHIVPDKVEKTAVGTVESVTMYDNYLSILLTDVRIDGKKLDYNATVYYLNYKQAGYINLESGSKISFKIEEQSAPKRYDAEGLPHTYNFKNNVGVCFECSEVELLDKNTSTRTKLLNRIRQNLRLGLNNQNGEMIYSAMFGDKTELSHELYDAYKGSGVAHLLAVSGLHVGLVVVILNWIMKKCRVKGWWRVGVIGAFLLCYAYLCGFSYSIIRASIMALVLMIAPLLFSEYDLLSSICFAGALILLIEPVSLFDVSALLSFGCVLGIAMLYPLFKKMFKRIHFNNGLSDAFGISLATLISTTLIMAKYFGYIQPVGLISNIIIIPIFGVLFTITFVLAMLSLILPIICYALILLNPLFEWLNWAIIFIASHSKSIMTPEVTYLTILLFFVWLTFVGKFNVTKGLNRITLICMCTSLLALQVAII